MSLAHRVIIDEGARRRVHDRLAYDEPCTARTMTRSFKARARNLSEGGLSLELRGLGKIEKGQTVAVTLEDHPSINGVVRWVKDRSVGLQFTSPLERHPQLCDLLRRLAEAKNSPANDEIPFQRFQRSDPEWLRPDLEDAAND